MTVVVVIIKEVSLIMKTEIDNKKLILKAISHTHHQIQDPEWEGLQKGALS